VRGALPDPRASSHVQGATDILNVVEHAPRWQVGSAKAPDSVVFWEFESITSIFPFAKSAAPRGTDRRPCFRSRVPYTRLRLLRQTAQRPDWDSRRSSIRRPRRREWKRGTQMAVRAALQSQPFLLNTVPVGPCGPPAVVGIETGGRGDPQTRCRSCSCLSPDWSPRTGWCWRPRLTTDF
jgi:hypothetical protein